MTVVPSPDGRFVDVPADALAVKPEHAAALAGFEPVGFEADGVEMRVWCAGRGPAVVVMPEIPGVTPPVLRFAREVERAGFRVYVVELFGEPGAPRTAGRILRTLGRVCVSSAFSTLALGRSSAITAWLRSLCRAAHADCGGPGVGAVGMCITGNFALAMMVEPAVRAPVLSQPSTPFPLNAARRRDVSVSDAELEVARRRVEVEGACVLGLRFSHDPACPPERFERLREVFGRGFEGVEIDSGPGNPHGCSRLAHSVLTEDLVDAAGHPTRAALDRVLAFLTERLVVGDAR